MTELQQIVQEYWDDLPNDMKRDVLDEGYTQRELLHFASKELGVEIDFPKEGRLERIDVIDFVAGVLGDESPVSEESDEE